MANDDSARGIINEFLKEMDLETLGQYAWQEYKKTGSVALTQLAIQDRPEYKERFAPRLVLASQGFQMSEAEQLAYERQARDLFQEAGMPKGFYDSWHDFTSVISSGISASELSKRINDAFVEVGKEPQVVRDAMASYYGVKGDAALAALALDSKKALPVIQRQVAAAEAGGYLAAQGMQISKTLAERIAVAVGNQKPAIQQGAEQIGRLQAQGLYDARFGETAPTVDTGVAAAFEGNAMAAKEIQQTIDTRAASTAGSEDAGMSRYGASGLGVVGNR